MSGKRTELPQLNSEQEAAVNAREGYYAVLAGPGSGKSSCLISRYVNLVASGVFPETILALTFTSEAAKNLRSRAEKFVDLPKGGRPSGFLTFHSWCLSFCTIEQEKFPFTLAPFPLATEGQSAKFAGDAARKYKVDYKLLRQWMSEAKRNRQRPEEVLQQTETAGKGQSIAMAYSEYEKRCRNAGVLDFDSLLMETVDLLERDPMIRGFWQYEWIMQDESQDSDSIQWRLIQLLSERSHNVWAVGDVGQCIYAWRSAEPELFLNFEQMFPGAKRLYLTRNYRSTRKLVDFFREIGPVKELAEKFYTENEDGVAPDIRKYGTQVDEADGVVKTIKQDGLELTSAILSRTNRNLRPFEEFLGSAGIRYHLLGRSGFFQQAEVKAVVSYVQAITQPFDSVITSCIRAPYQPTKYIRKKELVDALQARQKGDPNRPSLHKLLSEYRTPDENQQRSITGLVSFLRGLSKYRELPAGAAVNHVIQDLHAYDYYTEEEAAEADNNPVENLQELVRIASRFPSVPEFLEHVRKVSAASRVKKGVALSTVHQAKGREWDNVFVVCAEEGVLPHKNGELSEEERIWFVAASRAAKRLYISYSGPPSRFIQRFIENDADLNTARETEKLIGAKDPIEELFA